MEAGEYSFANGDDLFKFTISDDGWAISSVEINGTKETLIDGYWKEVNENAVEDDYDGPEGWYEFQTEQCNYNFDAPINGKLKLVSFDCKNTSNNKTVELTIEEQTT